MCVEEINAGLSSTQAEEFSKCDQSMNDMPNTEKDESSANSSAQTYSRETYDYNRTQTRDPIPTSLMSTFR